MEVVCRLYHVGMSFVSTSQDEDRQYCPMTECLLRQDVMNCTKKAASSALGVYID